MFAVPSAILLFAVSLVVPDANPTLFLYEKFFTNEKRLQSAFNGKRIWITGASSGIGAELARQLHGYGATLILSGRRETELNKIKALCEDGDNKNNSNDNSSASSKIAVLPFDVTDTDEKISDVVSIASGSFDGIDILILNAGAGQLDPAVDSSFSKTRQLMDINYMGPVRLAMEVMKKEGWDKRYQVRDGKGKGDTNMKGHIVVTSSVASKMALPLGASYAASKHAVHGYFISLRSECAEWLRIDLPCPGPIATAFQDNVLDAKSSSSSPNNVDDNEDDSELKMPVERCARLIISGMLGPSGLMHETWISRQPTLSFLFLNQYFPNLSNSILGIIGPLRMKTFRAGLPLYKVSSWLEAAKMEKDKKGKL